MTWLARLKNKNVPASGTAITDKRPGQPLLSVLSVGQPGASEECEGRRVVVRFRLVGGCPRSWCVALGRPGLTREQIIADLRWRHGDALIEVLP